MVPTWKNDDELFALIERELYTAVVGDIMDKMGLLHQFLPPKIQPLTPDMKVVGRAMTVLEADCSASPNNDRNNPVMRQAFGLMLEALDDLKPHEVYLCSGASPIYALWGELMTTRAVKLGAAGAVLNGYARDIDGILSQGFPTFAYGAYAQDQAPRGKVIDFRVPLRVGEVLVQPGDMVFGDREGVCVIPQYAADDIFTQALEKARGEKLVKQAIEAGMSAREAFDKFGIM